MQAPSRELLRVLRSATLGRPSPCHSSRYQKATLSLRPHSRSAYSSKSTFTTSTRFHYATSNAPKSTDRGPKSTEDTQTDFAAMNIFGNMGTPTTAIDACLNDGFHLDNGVKITNGDGVLLVGGEAFSWRPWEAVAGKTMREMLNDRGQWDVTGAGGAWGIFELVWPKPDLLILGLGANVYPLSPETRKYINSLGIRVDVSDTRNAAAQFNLLATERGIETVAAALIPIGWKGR